MNSMCGSPSKISTKIFSQRIFALPLATPQIDTPSRLTNAMALFPCLIASYWRYVLGVVVDIMRGLTKTSSHRRSEILISLSPRESSPFRLRCAESSKGIEHPVRFFRICKFLNVHASILAHLDGTQFHVLMTAYFRT